MRTKVLDFDSFHELLADDKYFGSILSEVTTGKRADFHLHDGFLFKEISCVPEGSLRQKPLRNYMMRDIWVAIRHPIWCQILIFGI